MALAESHLAAFDTYTVVVNDAAKSHFAKYTTYGTNRLTVAKYRAAGLTIDKVRAFYDNNVANASKMNPKLTVTQVAEEAGSKIFHSVAKLPFPMSNRSTVTRSIRFEESGVLTVLGSSKGCEAHVAACAKEIGKNVLANLILSFARYTPYEGGMDIVTIMCSDPAGSIPDAMKNKQATRNAQQPVNLANFMLTGASPSD